MPAERTGLRRLGGGALAASGLLFMFAGFTEYWAGAPPSGGEALVAWAASRAPYLVASNELLFFAALLLVPAIIALYQSLAGVDRARAAIGCGIMAVAIPVLLMLVIVQGRLVYPVFGLRANGPEAVSLVVALFYGGMHAVMLLMAAATLVLSLAMRRSVFGPRLALLGYATALFDVVGAYPDAIGALPTLLCRVAFAAWFMAVGLRLGRIGAQQ